MYKFTIGLLTDSAIVLLGAEQTMQDNYRPMLYVDLWRLMQSVCQAEMTSDLLWEAGVSIGTTGEHGPAFEPFRARV